MNQSGDRSPLVHSRTSFYLDRRKVFSEIWLLPNLISIARMLMIVPIVLLYPDPSPRAFRWALIFLCLSYLSDYADGVAARKLNLRSALGLILDPLADKLWSAVMLVLLVLYRNLPVWMAVIFIFRDVAIMALNARILRRAGRVMASNVLGKLYMILIGLLFIGLTIHIRESIWLGYMLLPLAVITVWNYFQRYLQVRGEFALSQPPEHTERIP